MKNLVCLFLFLPVVSNAQFLQLKSGESITITTPVINDLYVGGGTVLIDAPVYGDLIIAGGTITINDTIHQDILLAGGTVIFNGYVGDDIRSAGGTLRLSKNVGGDVVIAGGRVAVDEGVIIGGSLLVSGGDATVNGHVKGDMIAGAGRIAFSGIVEKSLDLRGGDITFNGTANGPSVLAAKEITIGSKASFHDGVRYWNKGGQLDFKGALKKGQIVFDENLKMETGRWQYLGFASRLFLLWYLGVALVMIFVIQYLFGSTMQRAALTALEKSLKSMGTGFLFVMGAPVVVFLAFISVVGIPLGVILLFAYLTVLFLSTSITSVVVANWINNVYYHHQWRTWQIVLTAFAVFIILKLAMLTPFAGPLIMVMLACLAIGAVLLTIQWKRQKVTEHIEAL